MSKPEQWHRADKGKVHDAVFRHVERIEADNAEMFDRFVKLACLYDPNHEENPDKDKIERMGGITENVVASNVDTVTAAIAANDVRARFQTDDADWSTQRRARELGIYAEEQGKDLDVMEKSRHGFQAAAIKGTGLNKVYPDRWKRIVVEPVPVDDVIVDEKTLRPDGTPRELHHRQPNVVAEDLIARYPKHREAIERVAARGGNGSRLWAGFRPTVQNTLVVIESWKLPIGVKGEPGYIPGRHTETIDGLDLLDEAWDEQFYPFAKIIWSKKPGGWYGISGAERIAGQQRVMNKGNFQIDRLIDQYAMPTTYVRMGDANLAVKSQNKLGTIAVYKQDVPKTIHPPAGHPELYGRIAAAKTSAFEEFGVSRLAAQSAKPAGLDSGVALREYRDQTTQRFSLQEKAFERFVLDTTVLVLWAAKKLGDKAPVVTRRTRFGTRKIRWADVDMRDVKITIAAASTIARTPAGRMQTVIEWAQAGVISQDEARRLIRHPDLEGAMSLYTAALENVEHALEEIELGRIVMPEPFMNLRMCVWRGQMRYLEDRDANAPERILEALRQFVVQAAWIESQKGAANANMAPMSPAAAAPGAMADPMADPMLAQDPGAGAAPVAAFSPQAMALRAS